MCLRKIVKIVQNWRFPELIGRFKTVTVPQTDTCLRRFTRLAPTNSMIMFVFL